MEESTGLLSRSSLIDTDIARLEEVKIEVDDPVTVKALDEQINDSVLKKQRV